MSYEDVSQCASGANFFECPSDAKFLGCCIDDDKDSVCRNGCPVDALQPAYFEPEHYDSLVTSYTQGQCDREYKWNICNSPSNEGWSFYGCYLLEGDPCGIFNLLELGNATTPADSTDSGAIASTSSSAAFSSTQPSQSVSANTTNDPPSLPTDFPLNDVPTWGASPAPSAPSTAVIAGGTIGGVAALAAIAALIGFLIVYLRRHRGRPEPDKQLSDDAALEATVQNGLVEEKPPREPTELAAPAYSPTDPNDLSNAPNRSATPISIPHPPIINYHPVSEIGTSDLPRPISEMASLDPADYPVQNANAAQLKGTGFIPYSAARAAAVSSGRREASASNLSLHSRVAGDRDGVVEVA